MAFGDVQRAAGELKKLNIADAKQQHTTTTVSRTNFPLPRELRDQIYGYLLHHEHIRENPYYTRERDKNSERNPREMSITHTYRFHVNIMSVNRQIYDEASRILMSNRFVTMSCAPPLDLEETPAKLESFLMIANDLPRLCTVIKYVQVKLPLSAQVISYTIGDPPTRFETSSLPHEWVKGAIPTIKLRFEDQKYCRLSSQSIKTLLEPFRAVSCGMQNVKLLNIPQDSKVYAQGLRQMMGLRTVWMNAAAWNYLELVNELKKQGDALVVARDPFRACNTYQSVWKLAQGCPILSFPGSLINAELTSIIVQFCVTLIVSAIVETLVLIKCGTIQQATTKSRLDVIVDLSNKITDLEKPNKLPATLRDVIMWAMTLYGFLFSYEESVIQDVQGAMQQLVQHHDGPMAAFFKHDLEAVEDHINRADLRLVYSRSDPAALKLLCRCLSASQLGVPMLGNGFPDRSKPSHLRGLIDEAHYAALQRADPKLAATLL